MDVRLLDFDGCHDWRETDDRLREAVLLAGLSVAPTYLRVATPEEAGCARAEQLLAVLR